MDMHIVRESYPRTAAPAIAKISSYPYRIDSAFRCDFEHT
jgi:hypothetical protein